jgi:hypothetical protein
MDKKLVLCDEWYVGMYGPPTVTPEAIAAERTKVVECLTTAMSTGEEAAFRVIIVG